MLQRLMVDREQLDAEEGRIAGIRRDLDQRLAQAASDLQREHARAVDGEQAVARLGAEREAIMDAAEGEIEARLEADAVVESAALAVAAIEKDLSRVMEEVAAADAERAAALRRFAEAEGRRDRLKERLIQLESQRAQAEAEGVERSDLTAAEMELESALEFVEESRADLEDADRRRVQAQAARDSARDALQAANAARSRLKAEAEALMAVLSQHKSSGHAPALDAVSATSGYEPALAAALGEDLTASLDVAAPLHWVDLPPLSDPPVLPIGVEPLARFVTAPPSLARRLSQVGVVGDASIAASLRSSVATGQRLVTRDGDLFRWDGYTARAGAPNPMALRLAQRNRLRELQAKLEDSQLGADEAEARVRESTSAVETATEDERCAKEAVKRAEGETAKAREIHARLAQRFAAAESRLAAMSEQCEAARSDMEEAEGEVMMARESVAAYPEGEGGKGKVAELRADLAERRSTLVEARSALDRIIREVGDRKRRLESLDNDVESWRRRAEAARAHVEELELRRESVMSEMELLSAMPDTIARRRDELLDRIQIAENARRAAADALIAAEQYQAEFDRRARAAEAQLNSAREDYIRSEAAVGAADQTCRVVASRIAERLDMSPENLRDVAGLVEGEHPDRNDLQNRHDRLNRERDAMGAVNLRAEQEVTELEERLVGMRTEKDDLVQAIARLRQGIGELNREGRERLLASFQEVDRHFRDLFVQLFGGGRAHLALTESTDPLQAGLEIMASPPGKRLQQLSLLSGGEQALTALALLFAVFMTNPAPICVLDEVDAPLDDANVDRFCSLVANIANTTGTRFLIVTHHRMTMARMDRLYGVTMAERGVSQLVSVDLVQAEAIRETFVTA